MYNINEKKDVLSMKAGKVIETLNISRSTLYNYVVTNKIRVTKLENGRNDYSDEDVYRLANKNQDRISVIYSRVSTAKQKNDLQNQKEALANFCINAGIPIGQSFADIASGISFEKRKEFFKMLDLILSYKVDKVVITYKDRLSRVGFELFKHLFAKFGTEIIVVSSIGSEKLDSQEIFEEIVSLLHCYSMKLYAGRRTQKLIKELIKEESDETSRKT